MRVVWQVLIVGLVVEALHVLLTDVVVIEVRLAVIDIVARYYANQGLYCPLSKFAATSRCRRAPSNGRWAPFVSCVAPSSTCNRALRSSTSGCVDSFVRGYNRPHVPGWHCTPCAQLMRLYKRLLGWSTNHMGGHSMAWAPCVFQWPALQEGTPSPANRNCAPSSHHHHPQPQPVTRA